MRFVAVQRSSRSTAKLFKGISKNSKIADSLAFGEKQIR